LNLEDIAQAKKLTIFPVDRKCSDEADPQRQKADWGSEEGGIGSDCHGYKDLFEMFI
jgi:hypothetical protein